MRPLRTLLALGVGVFVAAPVAHDTVAQTTDAPSKLGTRLITLGTVAGPPPRAHRAQSSNLLTVNGTHYVIDAGDRVASRIAHLDPNGAWAGSIGAVDPLRNDTFGNHRNINRLQFGDRALSKLLRRLPRLQHHRKVFRHVQQYWSEGK